MIFVVNQNFGFTINYIPIFQGEYNEFSVQWYRVIGTTIVSLFVLLVNVIVRDDGDEYFNNSHNKWHLHAHD